MIKKLSILVLLSFFLFSISGCAGKQSDGDRTRSEGAAVGAAGGAAIGTLMGSLIGGDLGGALVGAAAGAVVGGVSGYAYGDHVAEEKAKYASEEDWLDACVVDAKKINGAIVALNNQLQSDINALQEEAVQLTKQYSDSQKFKTKSLAMKKDIDAQLKSAKNALAAAQEELEAQKPVVAEAWKSGQLDYADDLDSEIAKLKAHIEELAGHTDELASMSANIAV